jgi:hypothetical protein
VKLDANRLAQLGPVIALVVLLANAPTVAMLARTQGEAAWVPWAVWATFVLGFLGLLLQRRFRRKDRWSD